jgi:hypothetical protein
MQNCFQDTMRDSTQLGDFFPGMMPHTPAVLCNNNINDTERVNKRLLETSVLLKDENININQLNNNYDERIYSRNVPKGDFLVNVDPRPLSSDPCSDIRFQKERDSLDKYNTYKSPQNMENVQKGNDVFLPQKGTVKGYFDNIDMDSEIRNINKIDTKCSLQLFKTHPLDSTSTLNENTDILIKNYRDLENNNGYTWDNFNNYCNFKEFTPCQEKHIPECPIMPKENKRLVTDPNIKRPGNIVKHCSLTRQQQQQELVKQKRDAEMIIESQKKPTVQRVDKDIVTYKSKGVTNIYAPVIKKENVNEDRAMARGLRDAAEIALRNPNIVRPKQKPFKQVETHSFENNLNLAQYNCVKEHQKLFYFYDEGLFNKDCHHCEKLFNNQTKRKHITPTIRN